MTNLPEFSSLALDELDEMDCVPSLPCFDISNNEDRPAAPSAQDYPLGCEVELLDGDFAKIAQEAQHWEPFMEKIFSVPRRRVKIGRHLGDYTFVLCANISGYELVGFTLYRACLREPKVKTTRYCAGIAAPEDNDDDNQLGCLYSEDTYQLHLEKSRDVETPDSLSFHARPIDSAHSHRSLEASLSHEGQCSANPAERHHPIDADSLASKKHPIPSPAMDNAPKDSIKGRATDSTAGPTFSAFNYAMKKGTHEIHNHNYEKALSWYNKALEADPQKEARVLSSRSVAYLLLKRTEDALHDAKRVIELQPESHLGYVRVGNIFRGMRQYRDAQLFYRDALKRDPTNGIICELFLENTLVMLYESRIKHFTKLKIEYNAKYRRAQLTARQPLREGEIVLKETTSLMAVISTVYGDVLGGRKEGKVCQNCGKPFVDEEMMCSKIPGIQHELFRFLCNEPEPVRCSYACGIRYCSNECRSKAWGLHHWMECNTRGRWKEGVKQAHSYLDLCIASQAALEEGDDYTQLSPLENMSLVIVSSTLRIAIRMFVRIMSCVWSLHDAVHMFDWLRVSPIVESQRSQVCEVVRRCYDLLSVSFSGEERSKLSYELFERFYERAKSHAVLLCVSAWGSIVLRAESFTTFIESGCSKDSGKGALQPLECTQDADRRGTASSQATGSVLPLMNSQWRCLDAILSAPSEGVQGTYVTVLAVFELLAISSVENMYPPSRKLHANAETAWTRLQTVPDGPRIPLSSLQRTNICLQHTIEPYVRIHVHSTAMISKGDALVAANIAHSTTWKATLLTEN